MCMKVHIAACGKNRAMALYKVSSDAGPDGLDCSGCPCQPLRADHTGMPVIKALASPRTVTTEPQMSLLVDGPGILAIGICVFVDPHDWAT